MPTISYITQLGTDSQLKQFNGQIYRRLEAASATSWTKIRIGIRFSVGVSYNPATAIFGTPRLYLGMCNFDKGGPATMSQVAHFIGLRNTGTAPPANGGGTSWTFAMSPSMRVNSIFTDATGLGGTYRTSDGTTLCMAAVEINKTTPGATVISHFRPTNSVTGIFNVTQDSFLEQMENSTPSLTGYSYNASGTTFNVDEATNGVLDSVCLAWDRTSIPLWIADICWSQLP
jgi:hypothetical protein